MQRFLLLLFIISFYPLSAQITLDVKVDGGAVGDGITDDTDAIQNTIDAVAAEGGGEVFFPEGTYLIRPVADPNPNQVICLNLPSDITLNGEGSDLSVIKLADNVGDFDAMLGHYPSFESIDNVTMTNLQLDANGANNPVASEIVLENSKRSIFRIYLGTNFLIEDCHFTNHKGVWNIVFNGITERVIIRNNLFDNIGDANIDWDHSTIYTNGDDFLLENNTFSSLFGAGTLGARTAIEIHGSNQIIRNNIIDGFNYGINVTGYSDFYLSRNQLYYGNTFNDVMDGFVLWSGLLSDPDFANGLDRIFIFENTVNINADGWKDWTFFGGGGGIVFERGFRDRDVDTLLVFNNTFNFTGPALNLLDESRYSSGVVCGLNQQPANIFISNFYLQKNTITNSNGPGIYFENKVTQSLIANNTIENAGNSAANLWAGFRDAFFLNDTVQDVQFSCNTILNNNNLLAYNMHNNGHNLTQGAYFQNTNATGLPVFYSGTDSGGEAWDTNGDRPEIAFAADTVNIPNNGSADINLILSEAASQILTVSLFPIDRNGRYTSDWIADQLTVTFNPGESSKWIQIDNLLGDQVAPEIAYLQIWQHPDLYLGCQNLLEIRLNAQNDNPLPVEYLAPLRAEPFQEGVRLSWATSQEEHHRRFVVQRSANAGQFEDIGQVPAGTSQHYAFFDKTPLEGHNYYRLRQEDWNGQFSYSPVVHIQFKQPTFIFPNPVQSQLQLTAAGQQFEQARIFNSTGQLWLSFHPQQRSIIDLNNLPAGIYLLELYDDPFGWSTFVRFAKTE